MTNGRFHPHIEGLRALAILLVLLFHAGLPLKGGYIGVDIFFVISGFLITGLLLKEIENTGDISLVTFYARRAKRLLPASCVALCFAALGVWAFAPASKQTDFGWDIASAAAYVANFRFAERSVDYLAEDVGRSPVLHFWSLAVEEQFYLIWPVLLLGGLRLANRTRWNPKVIAAALLLVVFLPSLVWSVVHTASDPTVAFFVTPARLWELSLGGLLAVAAPLVERIPASYARHLAAGGWLFIGASLALFDAESAWPGAAALLPTVGAALLITSGSIDAGTPLLRPLNMRPAVLLGGLSYSLYLWHWPFLVIGMDFLGLEGWGAGLGLVALSFIPAIASHRWIENKLRFSTTLAKRPVQALSLGMNFSLIALMAGLLFPLQTENEGHPSEKNTVAVLVNNGRVLIEPAQLGAGALANASRKSAKKWSRLPLEDIVPHPTSATKDVPNKDGCRDKGESDRIEWCKLGDDDGKIDVAVVGDSKIGQYSSALDAAGKALGWKIRITSKANCPFSAATSQHKGKEYKQCRAFADKVFASLHGNPPDLLITSQRARLGRLKKKGAYTKDGMAKGLAEYWSKLERKGTHVIVVLDNPHPPAKSSVYDCVSSNPGNYGTCAFSLKGGVAASGAPTQLAAVKLFKKVNVVDLTEYICPHKTCSPVIGGALVYRQTSHLTDTYAKTLAPILTRELQKAAYKADPKLARRNL